MLQGFKRITSPPLALNPSANDVNGLGLHFPTYARLALTTIFFMYVNKIQEVCKTLKICIVTVPNVLRLSFDNAAE